MRTDQHNFKLFLSLTCFADHYTQCSVDSFRNRKLKDEEEEGWGEDEEEVDLKNE